MKRWTMMVAVLALAMLVGVTQAKGNKSDKGQSITGEITKVDGANVTIQPHVNKGAAAVDPVVVITTESTAVTVDGVSKQLADLAAGQRVKVTLSSDGKMATAIAVGRRQKGAGPTGPAATEPTTAPAK